MKESILQFAKRKLAPQPVKIHAMIGVMCFTEGIDAIKEALHAGEAKGSVDVPIKVKLIAPPWYVMTTMTIDKELGLENMNQAIEAIGATVRAKGYVSPLFVFFFAVLMVMFDIVAHWM